MKPWSHKVGWDEEKANRLVQFVCEVSPSADPTSMLLFLQFHRASHQLRQAAERNLRAAGLSWEKFRMLLA